MTRLEPKGGRLLAGDVWVVDSREGLVKRIDSHLNEVVAVLEVGDDPGAIAAGEGAVWVANYGDGTITRVDPARGQVVATIVVGGRPTAIAAGAGAVWVHDQRGGLTRIDPATNGVTASSIEGVPVAATAASLWVIRFLGGDVAVLVRVHVSTRQEQEIFRAMNLWNTVLREDHVLVTHQADRGWALSLIDGSRKEMETPLPFPDGVLPGPVVLAGGIIVVGTIFLQSSGSPDRHVLLQVDPTLSSFGALSLEVAELSGLASTGDAVWVSQRSAGTVICVDPRTMQVRATVRTGGAPSALVVG